MKQHLYKRLLAFVLIFGLLLPTFADLVVKAVPNSTTSEVNSKNTEILNADITKPIEAVSVTELTRDSQILKHIDQTVLTANKHIARLAEEETLSSYAFLNSDGTKTVYYMDKEVKFLDKDGKTVEKDISLTNTLNGFTTVSNDIGLLLPNDPTNGISMSYNGYDIIIVPEGGSLRKAAQSNNSSVIYPDYFGSGMSLMYTPSLDGLKEDIVLSRYTGITTFVFRLFTDGLRPYQENNRYYLALSEAAEMRIDMGEVVAFDARGRFSVGAMNVTTVAEGQEYLLTLSVDAEFLTDETTTYPVSIDPTLTVSDNTHGAGAIEDITIYSGTPNANCDWSYLHCGYYSSTYKVARTMFRLTGLLASSEYQSASAADITSAEFHIQEATGTAALPVHIYSNTGNAGWTETGATWNNAGHALGTIYATVSPGVNQAVSYNITNLVQAWKNSTESAQAGFILVSSNETSLDKAFYSSETATTSYRSYVVVDYQEASDFSNAVTINSGATTSVNIETAGDKKYFKFTPLVTGFFTIQSSNSTGDPKVWLYNCDQAQLHFHDDIDPEMDNNFALTYHFIANATYYIAAGHYGTRTGTYIISIAPSTSATPPTLITTSSSFTKQVSIDYAYEVDCYMFTAADTVEYIFQSSAQAGDPKIWIYDSDLSLYSLGDDYLGNYNFRLEDVFEPNASYYVVVGYHAKGTGSYGFNILTPITLSGVNHLQNAGTGSYLDIQGTGTEEVVCQGSLHKNPQQRWLFQQQSNGYYTIQSQYDTVYYIGITNTNTDEDNVVLHESVSDSTLWKIYNDGANLLIEPKTAPGKVLCVPDDAEGIALQLCWMSSAVYNTNKWRIGVRWGVTLEGQHTQAWCWAAATRMLVRYYAPGEDIPSQEEVAPLITGSDDSGGTLEQAFRAVNYYHSGTASINTDHFIRVQGKRLAEESLRTVLDFGDILYIARRHYNVDGDEQGGHASVIGGYTTSIVNRELVYQYIIFDPYPLNPPSPWLEEPDPTIQGHETTKSYQWICYEYLGNADTFFPADIWVGFITASLDYFDSLTLLSPVSS